MRGVLNSLNSLFLHINPFQINAIKWLKEGYCQVHSMSNEIAWIEFMEVWIKVDHFMRVKDLRWAFRYFEKWVEWFNSQERDLLLIRSFVNFQLDREVMLTSLWKGHGPHDWEIILWWNVLRLWILRLSFRSLFSSFLQQRRRKIDIFHNSYFCFWAIWAEGLNKFDENFLPKPTQAKEGSTQN